MTEKIELSNKIRIVTNELKDRDSVSLGVWVGVGGRYEDDHIKGAAHFLEHVAFKGSKLYSCDAIKEKIEGVGGALNAFTAEEETCYFAKVPLQHLEKTFDILADIAFFPLIKKSDVEKERGVILEEIKMYHDLPQYHVMELLEELVWPNHPLGKNLTGTLQSVGDMALEHLRMFHQAHYLPNNIVISACGNFKHQKIIKLVESKLGRLKGQRVAGFAKAHNKQKAPRAEFFRKDTEQMHIALGGLGLPINHKDVYALSMLNIILGGNMSSRLFNEVREKHGLAYSISSGVKSMADTGIFMIRAGVDNKKLIDALDLILKVLYQIKRESVPAGELKRAKDYFLGQFLLALEDTLDYMLWIGETMISQNKVRTIQDVREGIQRVTAADIKRVAGDILKDSRLNLSVVGPLNDTQERQLRGLIGV